MNNLVYYLVTLIKSF